MQAQQNRRWRIAATVLTSVVVLAALVVLQNAAAIGQHQDPVTLQPPFRFQADERASAANFEPLPPTAARLLTETFDVNFLPVFNTISTTTNWYIFTDTGSANFYWNRVIPAISTAYSDTAWSVCGTCDGTPGTSLDPDVNTYPANVGTWMIYGPIDLSRYYDAELSFDYRLDANSTVDASGLGDFFGFGVSDDGSNFTGDVLTGSSAFALMQSPTFKLTDYAGKSSVYLGFYFHSNGDANVGKGALVDNVRLRALPYRIVFMPVVAKNYTASAPPGSFLYNYTWSVGGSNDPDLVTWGQKYTSLSGSTVIYEQGLTTGNPGSGMYLYNTPTYLVTMAGPNVTVSGNYEISAQFKVFKSKDNARYGIVFGANTSAFGRNGSIPTFNANVGYYRFALQFDSPPNGNVPSDYQLELCNTGDGTACNKLVDRTPIPAAANVTGVWDTLKVRRDGSQIQIYVNNYLLKTVSDGTYTGTREFGVAIMSANVNGTSNPLEIDWDNYTVSQLP